MLADRSPAGVKAAAARRRWSGPPREFVSWHPWVAVLAGALSSGMAAPSLTELGLRHLGRPDASTTLLRYIGPALGAVVGAATTLAALRIGTVALAVPLVAWGAALVAAGCCDAVTQRVPTALVRQAIAGVLVLLTCVFVLSSDWHGLVMSMLAAAAAGGVALLCWYFADAGYGDVRLAVLGGLGLGHSSAKSLLLAGAVYALIITVQVVAILATGGDRRTRIPIAPALAAGFVVAAAV